MKKYLVFFFFLLLVSFKLNAQINFTIDELLKASDELFTNKGQSADTGLYVLGESLFEAKKYDSASIAFSSCIIKNPLYIDAYYYRGISFMHVKKLDLALKDFELVIKLEPNSEGAYLNMGITFNYKKDFKNSLNCFNHSISLDNTNAYAYYYRALLKPELNYPDDDIIKDYNAILKLPTFNEFTKSEKAIVLNNKAYILVKMGILDEALQLVNKALSIDNSRSFIWDTRGEIYYKQRKFDECIVNMNKAIELDSDSENSYFYRGLAKIKTKIDGCQDLKISLKMGRKEAQMELNKYCNEQ